MEVHHHPQLESLPAGQAGKRFKEYFFEFIMIFLAVTLGFFAENIRERISDSHREKEFARELYAEFYADSIVFDQKTNARLEKEKDCDYLYRYLKDSSLTELPKAFYPAYTMVFYMINSFTFEPKDGVLNQVKNSGSLRYFKNPKLQKLFGEISVAINNVRYRNEQEYQFFANPVKLFLQQHYDFKWLDDLRKMSENSNYLELLNLYTSSDTLIRANILNLPSFNREEAANIVMFYKAMVLSSRTLQLKEYSNVNHELLDELRNNYRME